MSATVTLPVFIRVGDDGEECRVGEMTLEAGEDVIAASAEFFRGLADAVERTGLGEPDAEGG